MECLRISGNTLSFHYACREILQAAAGQSTGEDLRPSFATNGMEFRRIMSSSSSRLLEQLPSLSSQRHDYHTLYHISLPPPHHEFLQCLSANAENV